MASGRGRRLCVTRRLAGWSLLLSALAAASLAVWLGYVDIAWCGSVMRPAPEPWPSTSACLSERAYNATWMCLAIAYTLCAFTGGWHILRRGIEMCLRRLDRLYRAGSLTTTEYHEARTEVLEPLERREEARLKV